MFIFVIPQIRTLRRYFAVDRSLALLRCYLRHNIDRGYFRSYGFQKKAELYRAESKGQWHNVIPDYYGRFTDATGKLIDEDQYERNKDEAILSISKKEERPVDKKRDALWKGRLAKLLHYVCEEKRIATQQKMAELLSMDRPDIGVMVRSQRPEEILKKTDEAVN